MAVKLTDEQQQAVSARNRQLIVSAAAGSGKTAVLVRRVISLLCDEKNPCGLENMLVVTFTNAAAAEMRGKIAAALLEQLSQTPNQPYLRQQLAILPGARIQTVHAFCLDLLRQNFSACGVSPDFSMADETDQTQMKENAVNQLLEEAYAQADPAFLQLTKSVCEERGDSRLAATIVELYDRLRGYPHPEKWLRAQAEATESGDISDAYWVRFLISDAKSRLEYSCRRLEEAYAELQDAPEIFVKYGPTLDWCITFSGKLFQAIEAGWDAARAVLEQFSPPAFKPIKDGDPILIEHMKCVRDQFKQTVSRLKREVFCCSSQTLAEEMIYMRPRVAVLCKLAIRFEQLFKEEKARRDLLDFSDLEQITLNILTDESGHPTQLASQLSGEIRQILVDEYQDTNSIQDAIFRSIQPTSGGMFFVGDVKQSIYRFRLANPEIFLEKYRAYPPLIPDGEQESASLDLNQNFRSRPEVLELINFIFSRVMTRQLGELDYDKRQRLVPGVPYTGCVPCELHVIDMAGETDDEAKPRGAEAEAKLTAARVAQLLQTETVTDPFTGAVRPLRPSDIAILLSSYQSKAKYWKDALIRAGIPAQAGEDNFFDCVEIQSILSMLRVIDNRRQDIPLIALMRSPFYFFSADELAEIRLQNERGDFWDACVCAAQSGNERVTQMLSDLDGYWQYSLDRPVSRLLQHIYSRTGALGIFSSLDKGASRKKNLETLYQAALHYEANGTRGLCAFLQYMDAKALSGKGFSVPSDNQGVQIMSIHQSKGLEYPVVFVCDLGKAFNTDDLKKPVLFHPQMGIALKWRDTVLRTERKTRMMSSIGEKISREQKSEELRKLYVAMTRAKERLILMVSLSDAEQKLKKWEVLLGGNLDPQVMCDQSDAALWVCGPLLFHPAGQKLRAFCSGNFPLGGDAGLENLTCSVINWMDIPSPDTVLRAPDTIASSIDQETYTGLLGQIEKTYPHLKASVLPSKLTPTGVKVLIEGAAELDGREIRMYHQHSLTKKKELNSAEQGTALHRFLQYADWHACLTPEGAEREKDRMLESGVLTEMQADSVDKRHILRFLNSPLGLRALSARNISREYTFGALFTPYELLEEGPEDEQILLNGVVDLLIWEENGFTVVDFKSDRVEPGKESEQAEKYRTQLSLYARAIEKITGQKATDQLVFFLRTGETVAL